MAGAAVSPGDAESSRSGGGRAHHGNRGPKDGAMGGWRRPGARPRGPEEGTES